MREITHTQVREMISVVPEFVCMEPDKDAVYITIHGTYCTTRIVCKSGTDGKLHYYIA